MITIKASGDYGKALRYFEALRKIVKLSDMDKYGRMGVDALRDATPKDTGKTSESWRYIIEKTSSGFSIEWINDNVNNHVNIAIILQYGHGTRFGAYVQGVDYINPALKPVFDSMADSIWKEVTRL